MRWIVLQAALIAEVVLAEDRVVRCPIWTETCQVAEWAAADQVGVAEEWAVAGRVECREKVEAVIQATEAVCLKGLHLSRSLHCRKIEGKTNLCADCCKAYRFLASESMFIPNFALGYLQYTTAASDQFTPIVYSPYILHRSIKFIQILI